MFSRALEIKEARLERGDPSIAITLNGLAGVFRETGRRAEAEAAYKRALAIRERAFKPGNADLAETVADYAGLLRETGRVREAEVLSARFTAR